MKRHKQYIAGNYPDTFTASSKAKLDAEEILKNLGFSNCGLSQSHIPAKTPKAYLRLIRSIMKTALSMSKNGILFLQHPCSADIRYAKIAKKRNNKIILLIHDLNHLRDWNDKGELELIEMADVIIVHTSEMAQLLKSYGIDKEFVVLEIFDYLHGSTVPERNNNNIKVAFAGNLGKSKFLEKIKFENINLNLYGIGGENKEYQRGIEYKGCFPPDKLAENMEADYGLVWDGDSIQECTGQLGEYLRIIAPHKLSMYLSAKLPVIVWSESAMAKFVEKYNVGITISSLEEIEKKLPPINSKEYEILKNNVNDISHKLSEGYFLTKALDKAIRLLNAN